MSWLKDNENKVAGAHWKRNVANHFDIVVDRASEM